MQEQTRVDSTPLKYASLTMTELWVARITASAGHVAVDGFDLVADFLQAFGHFFGHHHAAMLAAGAAKSYG